MDNHKTLRWSWRGRSSVTSAAKDKFIRVTKLTNRKLTAPQIRTQINASQSSRGRLISTTTAQRRVRESRLQGQPGVKKPPQKNKNNKKKRTGDQETQRMDITPVEICSLLWTDFWFHPPCLCKMQKTHDFYMCGSHHEAQRRRCDCVGVFCWWHCWWFISNWTSMDTSAFCNNILSHLVFVLSETMICFLTGQWPQTHVLVI